MRRWLEPLGGLLFAMLVAGALAFFGDQPGPGASGSDVLAYERGTAPAIVLGDGLWVLAAACFGIFLTALRRELVEDARDHPWLVAIGTIAAGTGIVLFSLSALLAATLAAAATAGSLEPAAALSWWRQENAAFALSLPFIGVALLELAFALWRADLVARLVATATIALGGALLIPGIAAYALPFLLVWAAGGSISMLLGEIEHRPLGHRVL